MSDEQQEQAGRKYEELRLLYQMVVSDIAFFKQQQWRVTNYGLLVYAAVITIPTILEHKLSLVEYSVLFIIAFVALGTGWYLLGLLEDSLKKGRCRLTETRKYFTDTFKDAWRCGKPKEQAIDRPEDKPSLLWLFRAVFGSGFLIVSWLLYRMACTT